MSLADHHEKTFSAEDTVKDIVIGMADGLCLLLRRRVSRELWRKRIW
jgi:hypothetical protein